MLFPFSKDGVLDPPNGDIISTAGTTYHGDAGGNLVRRN